MIKMTYNNVVSDINNIKKIFASVILESLVEHDGSLISWPNYQRGISKKMYIKEYEELKYGRQYSFMFKDKSFIQIYYEFDNDKLLKVKLAYYPYPIILNENHESLEGYWEGTGDDIIGEYYFDLCNILEAKNNRRIPEKLQEEIEKVCESFGGDYDDYEFLNDKFENKYLVTNSSHIRIDFDSKVTTHHKTEIQYSSINNIRLPFNKIISPFIFVDFVVRNVFNDDYQTIKASRSYAPSYQIALNHSGNINHFQERNIFISHF